MFDTDLPIIQAPMAGVQGADLAVAVSNAGGLGSLPAALLGVDDLRRELTSIKTRTTKPYNVNFFCHAPPRSDPDRDRAWLAVLAPFFAEYNLDPGDIPKGPGRSPFDSAAADVIAELRPPVVSFHFGLPADDLLNRVRQAGARILSTATTVEEARWLEARGVDAIIAQGSEAGGHRGMFLTGDAREQVGTLALVRQIARAVRLPVIAAGGIADAEGVAAVLALGAAAAQVGTAYLLCPEATTRPLHRTALASEAARHTAITNVFTGRPARGIVNRAMRELGFIHPAAPAFPEAAPAMTLLRIAAERAGSSDFSPLWAGQNTTGCSGMSAGDVTRVLAPGPRP